ncbi:MAG: cation:dicarboxylase symporter family transporter, partial [Oscillospiraceae bacterium]|nr:cation:dicarboxylase symporter family transporter [Oscillospiraceae bacterium]
MAWNTKTYPLEPQAIDQIADEIQSFLISVSIPGKDCLRLRLAMEEILLRVMESPMPPESVELGTGKRFGRTTVSLHYGGVSFDPTQSGEEDLGARILENLGMTPAWDYRGGVNRVTLRPPKASGRSRLFYLLVAVAAAAVLGAAGGLLPESFRAAVIELMLTPMFDAFLGLINTIAGIMIFATVAAGVFGIGDTAALSRIGKVMFSRFLISALATAVLTLLLIQPFLHVVSAPPGEGQSQASEIVSMIFGILPDNPVLPFLSANTLEIIVMAVFTGVVLLILGERTRHLGTFVEECSTAFQTMMEYVCKLIPLFVFVSLLRQIWSGAVAELLGLWKPFLLLLMVNALVIAIMLLRTSLRVRVSPLLLLRKVTPAFFVAFTTASSMASYSTAKESCERKLGINSLLFDFGYPTGIVTYMPAAVITFCVLAGYFAELYGAEVSLAWYIMAGLVGSVLSVACPPTPGAMLTCYGILLAQL